MVYWAVFAFYGFMLYYGAYMTPCKGIYNMFHTSTAGNITYNTETKKNPKCNKQYIWYFLKSKNKL